MPRGLPEIVPPMSSEQFRKYGHQIIDWAVEFMKTVNNRNPTSPVKPGWLWKVVPTEAPENGEPFENIINDLEKVVCDGMAHWQHRLFFAYFPAGNSWPSILGDIFSNGMAANGQTWYSCPVSTELECIVMDWCCKFLGLPQFFLSTYSEPRSHGQGILQCSASEAIFYSMVWAREDAVRQLRARFPTKKEDPVNGKSRAELLNMLVAYCNNECHCCVERAAMMGCVRIRKLKADKKGVVRSTTLMNAIEEDMEKGLIPFFHCAIIGSTGVTSYDDLMEVGPVCEKYSIWLHVDAVRYRTKALAAFAGPKWEKTTYKYPNNVPPDLKHYGVASSRRLRAFKLYCVIRNYGVEGIRRYIRNHISLARLFEAYVERDPRFELCGGSFRFGLVTFRLKGYNSLTQKLNDAINASHKIHMVPSHFHDKVVIRFALCAEYANERDVDDAWNAIDHHATEILHMAQEELKNDRAMRDTFMQQRKHDIHFDYFPHPDHTEKLAEAKQVAKDLEKSIHEDALIKDADNTAVDGSWGHGDPDAFSNYDKKLRDNPEMVRFNWEEDYLRTEDPKFSKWHPCFICNATENCCKQSIQ
ncbi:Tyrosine decarboxylase [Orchesella cincta]|uniref:Tyrosine decarboxylase n=1 Tax=Orchesella cincta TaxID=48709 RepID=A0A1D2MW96_ORCCI|nr:Tyrosine decarboxylase [Orchesella cincta]